MYADDTILTPPSSQDLQAALNKIIKWAKTNDLQMNKEMTEMMVFRKGAKVAMKITYRSRNTELRWYNITISLLRNYSSDFWYIILNKNQRKNNSRDHSHALYKKYRSVVSEHGK
jgi:hypothetical protein